MPRIVVPSNLDTRLYNTLRNIVQELEDTGTNIPLLKTLAQVRNIPNETSAYLIVGGVLYRYTKVDGKLFREEVDDEVGAPAYGTVLGDPVRTMPIEITPNPIVITDPVEPAPTPTPTIDPTEITISDIIDDSVGDLRVNLLEVREVSADGNQAIPVVFLTIDGKLYYCAEGTYFNKFLNIDVTIGDDTTQRETQRPTVSITAPSNHSGEPFTVTIPFSREISGFRQNLIQVTGATLRDFSGSGKTYRVVVVPSGTDDIRLFIPANIVTDKYLLHNIASDRITVTYQAPDTTRPAMSIYAPASYQGMTAFQIRIRSSEVVSSFVGAFVNVVGGTLSNFQATGMTNTVYTADITPTGTGIIRINIPANVTRDSDGNLNTAAREARVVTVPSVPQSLTTSVANESITARWQASASANGSPILRYEVRVDTEDWINVGRNLEYTFTGLTNSQQYSVQVRAVNDVGYSTVASVNATPVATDSTRPTIEITAPTMHDGTAFSIGVSASEELSSFALSNLTLTNATASGLQGATDAWSATITPSGTGTVTIQVVENAVQDTASNGNIASNTASITYVAPATVPNPARNLILTVRNKEIYAVWEAPSSNGGIPIMAYEIQLDTGSWIDLGLQTSHTFQNLTNGQSYSVTVRVRNRVGLSVTVSDVATPEAPQIGDNVNHQLFIDFDNMIIGDPEEEERFWRNQGMNFTCAAVSVGSALTSLGVISDPFQVVRDATQIIDSTTNQPLGDVVIDISGNAIRNTPTILNRGEALYHQLAERAANDRYLLREIRWNLSVYPVGRLADQNFTPQERGSFTTWYGVNFLVDHYDVDYHVGFAYDFSWLVRELEAANKVIAFVDANEIWGDPNFIQTAQIVADRVPIQDGNDLPAGQVTSVQNHAIWITGIDLKDPANPKIIINDSGQPSGESATYSLPQFLASWEDAEFIYTAIGSDELPDTPTIDGAELDKEHRELQRIIKLHRPDLLEITGLQTYPFFDLRNHQTFLQRAGIADRYNDYVFHVAQEQQRIIDAYGLNPNTIKNVLDVLSHE